jgi:hypothetical protein
VKCELERMWIEVVEGYFKCISQHLTRATEENHETCHDGWDSCLKFESSTPELRHRSSNHSNTELSEVINVLRRQPCSYSNLCTVVYLREDAAAASFVPSV